MSKIIETTVAGLPEALSHADVDGEQLVIAHVYSAEDTAEIYRLRRLVKEGEESGDPIDGKVVEEMLLARNREEYGTLTEKRII